MPRLRVALVDNSPFVTVIMPIRNEAAFIKQGLGAVLAQDYPAERMEVIIADGMSDDGTREIVQAMQAQYSNLRLIDNPGKIVPTALNAAIAQARGDVMVRVDGHTIIAPDYVRECIAALKRSGADNVGGRMDAVNETPFGRAVALATSSPFGVGGARFHYSNEEEWVDTVYMGAWRRDVFERIGLFDEEQVRNQDDEFNYRLLAQGGKILLSPRIKSQYYSRSTLRSLWKQYFQYGYWKVRVMQKHPRQMRPRQFAPPALAGALTIGLAAAPFSKTARRLFAGVAGLYLTANLLASVLTARKGGVRSLPLLPPTFATLHLAYGLGFLIGLVKFCNRWGDRANRTSSAEGQPGEGQA